MKLLLLGATGGTGSLVLEQALKQGHHVTAFVRNPSKICHKNPALTIVQGNVMDLSSVENAMKGQEAVICCIGTPAHKPGNLRSEGTKNIIRAMEKTGVKRFICQTSLGYGESTPVLKQTSFVFKKMIVPLLLKKTFADHYLQEEFIRQTDLNWTIVRAGSLTNGKPTGSYQHGFSYNDKAIKVKVARGDVADFLIQQISVATYLKHATGISY
jgi:putative NADH-flavin reductase